METVGRLAQRFGLSRSTLLYYGRIGLLRPSARSRANYRLYGKTETQRLARICMYRDAGLPLREIKTILDGGGKVAATLQRRLVQLNNEISRHRHQQRILFKLLENRQQLAGARTLDKDRWVALLRATGLSDDDMRRWHVEFERMAPQGHEDFLEGIGIPPEEIRQIRRWSRRADT